MTATKSMEEILLDDVCGHLGNMTYCSILADWYGDQGDALREECWRLIALREYVPDYCPDNRINEEYPNAIWWWWYHSNSREHSESARLPDIWTVDMGNDGAMARPGRRDYKRFVSPQRAYSCLVQKYLTLTQEERKILWESA